MTLVELMRDKVEADYLNGELFWRVRELSLGIFGKEEGYFLILCKNDNDGERPVGVHTIAATSR